MLTLITSNPSKYTPFEQELARLRIGLEQPPTELPELQTLSFPEALAAKAKAMSDRLGRLVLVDDAGLILEDYKTFPGPLTSVVLQSLGTSGLQRLLRGTSNRAAMECHIGCWLEGQLRSWSGRVEGHLDFSRVPKSPKMPLSDIFVSHEERPGVLLHRARALKALARDAFDLHLRLDPCSTTEEVPCRPGSQHQCAFCAELDGEGQSVFAQMVGNRLPSRIVYEDEDFVLMPPLGEFMAGGLLLLTRLHILSLAYLPVDRFARLEQLLECIRRVVQERWGVAPLIFEHGPAPDRTKGVCCVDHAHLNIFPSRVPLHAHLSNRMHLALASLNELSRLRRAEFGYLFIQENDGTRRAYDGQLVPTQLVRRIIANALGLSERWHWQDYPGVDELIATYEALKGRIALESSK